MKEYEKATACCRICKEESPEFDSKDKADELANKHEKESDILPPMNGCGLLDL